MMPDTRPARARRQLAQTLPLALLLTLLPSMAYADGGTDSIVMQLIGITFFIIWSIYDLLIEPNLIMILMLLTAWNIATTIFLWYPKTPKTITIASGYLLTLVNALCSIWSIFEHISRQKSNMLALLIAVIFLFATILMGSLTRISRSNRRQQAPKDTSDDPTDDAPGDATNDAPDNTAIETPTLTPDELPDDWMEHLPSEDPDDIVKTAPSSHADNTPAPTP